MAFLYTDGWVGFGGALSSDGPNGKAGDPDPFNIAYVRQATLPSAPTSFLERHKDAPSAASGAPSVTACEVTSCDFRSVWLAFNQPVQLSNGRVVGGGGAVTYGKISVQVTVDGEGGPRTLTYLAGIDQPLPWVLRIRLPEDAEDVRNDPGTHTARTATAVQVTFPANTLTSQTRVPNGSFTANAVRYPVWTLTAPKWHSKFDGGSNFAPLWVALYSLYGTLTPPFPVQSVEALINLPTEGPTIDGVQPPQMDSMVPPQWGQLDNDSTGTRMVLEGAPDGSGLTTATVTLRDERVYGVPVKVDGSASPQTEGTALALQQIVITTDGSATYGRLSLAGQEACAAIGGGGTVVIDAYGTVYGGNVEAESGTPPTAVYPVEKPYIFDLAPEHGQMGFPESPTDWRPLDLPFNFKHGDPVPQRLSPVTPTADPTALVYPDGVGWVRLSPGSPSVDGKTWNADLPNITEPGDVNPLPYGWRWDSALPSQLVVYFTQPLASAVAASFTLSGAGSSVTSASVSGLQAILTLSAPLVVGDMPAIQMGIGLDAVTSGGGSLGPAMPVILGAGTVVQAPAAPPTRTATMLSLVCDPAYAASGGNLVKIRAYFDMSMDTVATAAGFTVGVAFGAAQTVTAAAGNSAGYVDITITPGLVEAQASALVTVSMTIDSARAAAVSPVGVGGANAFTNQSVQVVQPRNCYVLVLNRRYGRTLNAGDYVDIDPTPIPVSDRQGSPNSRNVFDARPRAKNVLARPSLYYVEGGNILTNFGLDGIIRVNTAVTGASLPVGVAPPGVTSFEVPAFPIPSSLPNGIGVGRLYGENRHSFLLLDSNSVWGTDVVLNQPVFADEIVTLIRNSGGVDYVYTCRVIFAGF